MVSSVVVVVVGSVVVVVGSVVVVVGWVVVVGDDDVVGGSVVVVADGLVGVVDEPGSVVVVGPGPLGVVDGGVVVVGDAVGLDVRRRGGRPTGVSGSSTVPLVVVVSLGVVVGVVVVGIGSPGLTVVAAASTAASSLGSHDLVGSLSASSTSEIALASA